MIMLSFLSIAKFRLTHKIKAKNHIDTKYVITWFFCVLKRLMEIGQI